MSQVKSAAKISKEAEEAIMSNISKVVEAVDSGLAPAAALTKVATENKLMPNAIRIVGRAYNTGRQEAQRNASTGVLSKFGSFDMAAPEETIQELYPTNVETPKQASAAVAMSSDYAGSPAGWGGLPATTEKAAHLNYDLAPMIKEAEAAAPPVSEQLTEWQRERQLKQAYDKISLDKVAVEELRYQSVVAHDIVQSAIGNLATFMKSALDFADVESNVGLYWGGRGVSLMSAVASINGIVPEKRAQSDYISRNVIDRTQAPYSLVDTAIKAAVNYSEATLTHKKAQTAAEKEAGEVLLPFQPKLPALNGNPGSILPVKAAGFALGTAAGAGARGLLGNALSGSGEAKPTSELVDDKWTELEDPNHENQLKMIQTQAMLHDMMANDEVISGYDPDEVLSAFNEIASATPRAAAMPMVMNPLLRRRLQGNIEPFEAGEALQMEQRIADTSQSTPDTQRLSNAPSSVLG